MVAERFAEARSSGRALVLCPIVKHRGDHARLHERTPQARLDEASGLAAAIRLDVVHAEIVNIERPRPATLIGAGAVERLETMIADAEVTVAVVDAAVSPVQQRNLERAWHCKVIDRTALILEIFGERARTHEGRQQVELAALDYQRSRLVRSWTHLERQRGGFGFLGGPGESQLELDRRLIGERIARLRRDIADVKRTRELQRRARRRVPYPIVALVGYTNAGKSTLFNRLTGASVFAADALFATLDPTLRLLPLPSGRKAIIGDTVGFISQLPTHLIAAFRATLEEVAEADLILHVRDVSHSDAEAQRDDVLGVLDDLGLHDAAEHRLVEVLNKIDLLEPEAAAALRRSNGRRPAVVPISAATGEGCDALLELIDHRLAAQASPVPVSVALSDGADIAWLYRHGSVLERHDDDNEAHLLVSLLPADQARFAARRRHADGDGAAAP